MRDGLPCGRLGAKQSRTARQMTEALVCCPRMQYAVYMTDEAPDRVIARIKERIEIDDNGCWMFRGALSEGYGHLGWRDPVPRTASAHRVMYTALRGPIPRGLDLDHLCHDPAACSPDKASDCPHRACCNPDHLAAVTRRENLLRGGTVSAMRRATTHCPQGHELTEGNTLTSSLGQRQCKECAYERNRAYYWKNRERRSAYNKAWREKQQNQSG